MSRLTDTMYDYRPEIKALKIIDICSECGDNIYYGKEYYEINGKIICTECMDYFKKTGGEDE